MEPDRECRSPVPDHTRRRRAAIRSGDRRRGLPRLLHSLRVWGVRGRPRGFRAAGARPLSCGAEGRSSHREHRSPHSRHTVTEKPYELVIGFETHLELATETKMFCGCSARTFGAPPNSLVCPVCLGLPGSLPVTNRRAIELGIAVGLALHCEVPEATKFDRKNYMYPDLPKGYQISQYDLPLNVNGYVDIETSSGKKRVRIRRVHVEEDTGRLLHVSGASLVDFNRSGVPLMEIVTEPDMRTVEEGLAYAQALREILVYTGASEARMEEGAIRFEPNISIRFQDDGKTVWPPQSEIKNLNSFRAVERAIAYESERLSPEWR